MTTETQSKTSINRNNLKLNINNSKVTLPADNLTNDEYFILYQQAIDVLHQQQRLEHEKQLYLMQLSNQKTVTIEIGHNAKHAFVMFGLLGLLGTAFLWMCFNSRSPETYRSYQPSSNYSQIR